MEGMRKEIRRGKEWMGQKWREERSVKGGITRRNGRKKDGRREEKRSKKERKGGREKRNGVERMR